MKIGSSRMAALFAASAIVAAIGFAKTSFAVPHTGEILSCGNCGGVGFSWFHRSNSNPATGGGFLKAITPGTAIGYEWLPGGAVGANSRQIFNKGSTRILDSSVSGIGFSVDLWTDHSGNLTGSAAGDLNVLSVRTGSEAGTPASTGPFLGFTLTQKVSARFGFTITTANATVFDEFVFDPDFDMGPVDGIGNDANGAVGTFLWGYTSGYDSQNPFGSTSSTVCLSGGTAACTAIVSALYGVKGVGVDLAYSGQVPVPEPAAAALFVIGLAGLGFARRRRRIAT